MKWITSRDSWAFILTAYLPRLALCSLTWEILQLPLYTLWAEPHWQAMLFPILHCTAGDIIIGGLSLLIALTLNQAGKRNNWSTLRICAWTIALAVSYTVFSERNNLTLGNWAYSAAMPIVPWIEVGIAPIAQWIIVPLLSWRWAQKSAGHSQSDL